MSARLGDRPHQFETIGRGQLGIDLPHLATAQRAVRGAEGALEAIGGFEYLRRPGHFESIRTASAARCTGARTMNRRDCQACLVTLATAMAFGCAGPKPTLYPNAHYQSVGERVAQSDIEGCREMADAAGAHRDPGKVTRTAQSAVAGGAIGGAAGAAGGAVFGHAARGAAAGAASGAAAALMRALFFQRPKTSEAHISYVNRCLEDKGYEPIGWQ